MNAFDSIMQDVDRNIAEAIGQTAVYRPLSGGVIKTPIVLSEGVEVFGYESGVSEFKIVADLLRADVPNPARGDKITADGVTYTVQDKVEGQSDESVIRVTIA